VGASSLSESGSGPVDLAPSDTRAYVPQVAPDGVSFTFPDPDRSLGAVVLRQDLQRPRHGPEFTLDDRTATWNVFFARPRVNRMEYRLELVRRDGGNEEIADPGNPNVAPGPFGDKSVIEWPEYSRPGWCGTQPDEIGTTEGLELASRVLRARVPAVVWTSPRAQPTDELPLLVAHDGPELAQFSDLLHLLAVKVESGDLPPMRAALLAPVDRDQNYSASAVYARALALEIIPALTSAVAVRPGRIMRVAMGASLGALSMLHAHRTHPALFGALFMQSGSFFRQRFDPQEAGFVRFRRITRFVGQVLAAEEWPHPLRIAMTCGSVEENLANNRATFSALRAQGYDGQLHEVPDAHNWIAWRDAFDPHLVGLLARMWT
jgi:enterochelin esterase-like enzyme